MATSFTVIQCVPDPIADERMNVGVVVFGDGQIRSRFVRDWRPVSAFARENVTYLKDFAARFAQATQGSPSGPQQLGLAAAASTQRLTEAQLASMINNWSNSIQFSPPQVSLEQPDALLDKLAELYLRDAGAPRRFRDRRAAVQLAVNAARDAVERRLGAAIAKNTVRHPYVVSGALASRLKLDMAVKNGRLYVATQALSFESWDVAALDAQARESLYMLKDVGDAHPGVRLEAVVLPPNPSLDGFQEARQRFNQFRAESSRANVRIVEESETFEWAGEIANLVEAEIAPHLQPRLLT